MSAPRRPLRSADERERIRRLVRRSWNQLSYTYRPRGAGKDVFGHSEADYRSRLGSVLALPRGAGVLDLGSGTGVPTDRLLAARHRVTGVDLSDVMVRRARRLVPGARFLRADMSEVGFPPNSFDAVVSLYAIFHLPVEEHRPLFRRIRTWLRPGGLFVAILGHGPYEGTERRWLGSRSTMFWSHGGAATDRRRLADVGFEILHREYVPEGEGGHELFVCRKQR